MKTGLPASIVVAIAAILGTSAAVGEESPGNFKTAANSENGSANQNNAPIQTSRSNIKHAAPSKTPNQKGGCAVPPGSVPTGRR
jgi:hypothetical protein